MQLSKIFKGITLALPIVTMVACSSGPSEEELAAESNRVAAAQAEADRKAAEEAKVQAGNMKPMLSPEEVMQKEKSALMDDQVVYFDFDRSSVSSKYYSLLDQHAAFLLKNPGQAVVIEGHCDNRGTPEYNIALGERRAKSVETYLMNAGVSASQVSVVSYGEEKPVDTSGTAAAFAENRRGVLVYQ
ncbi:peptidoglycan-associated lipoprotein Pal [Paraglaciecola mesophila]|uniref:Peptidoglycan-associated lipoprotein n=2 Tax=Paraglaciecola mesophila TaxID=197222 RepID=K6Z507_9ALTE|nr:peptidoglycan-associated lipoprotein Pal [Paraglaciecola mesophila]GAC25462.1 peptidoglycan-associated lipoprotein [Paraglaciecola mesophila KMM 241]